MKIKCQIIEERMDQYEEAYNGYGIAIYACQEEGEPVDRISDISTNVNLVDSIISMCNRFKLSPIHVKDVVEDMLP